jgi:hypothetical protein
VWLLPPAGTRSRATAGRLTGALPRLLLLVKRRCLQAVVAVAHHLQLELHSMLLLLPAEQALPVQV